MKKFINKMRIYTILLTNRYLLRHESTPQEVSKMKTLEKLAILSKVTLNLLQLLNKIGIINLDIPDNFSNSIEYACDNIEDIYAVTKNIYQYIRNKICWTLSNFRIASSSFRIIYKIHSHTPSCYYVIIYIYSHNCYSYLLSPFSTLSLQTRAPKKPP